MCDECDQALYRGITLVRKYPKNKVGSETTPAEYLED